MGVQDKDNLNGTLFLWKGKEYIYSKCRNRRWIGTYPVMFHGHVTHSPAYLEAFQSSFRKKRKLKEGLAPSHREVYALLSSHDWALPEDLHGAFQTVFAKTR